MNHLFSEFENMIHIKDSSGDLTTLLKYKPLGPSPDSEHLPIYT